MKRKPPVIVGPVVRLDFDLPPAKANKRGPKPRESDEVYIEAALNGLKTGEYRNSGAAAYSIAKQVHNDEYRRDALQKLILRRLKK